MTTLINEDILEIVVKIVLGITAGLIVIVGIFWYQLNKSTLTPTASVKPSQILKTPSASSSTVMESGNTIQAKDQSDGDVLTIELAVLDKPGFIILHKATKDGVEGAVMGHSDLLSSGQHENTDIDISPNAKKGDFYIAALHEDTNGDKMFSGEDIDKELKDEKGKDVMMKFSITTTDTPPASTNEQ